MVLFRSIHMKGTTVIVATHSKELLEDAAQRTIILNRGRIVEDR
jgi:ABC-type ATPase involved in cell division